MELSPEIIKMRDAFLERVGNKSLKEVSQIVNEIMLNETNSTNRLAALAARVKVLRDYINKNYDLKKANLKRNISHKVDNVKSNNDQGDIKNEENNNATKNETEISESWVRVEMLKSGVVNGVRFPEGVVIDVNNSDAEKLVSDGLSRIIKIDNTSAPSEKKEEAITEQATEAAPKKEEAVTEQATEAAPKKEEAITEQATEAAPKKEETEEKKEAIKEKTDSVKTKEALSKESEESEESKEIERKILKKKSTKITEETIELTDPKAVAEALGLNEKKKKEEEPQEVEEEIDIEALEIGKKK